MNTEDRAPLSWFKSSYSGDEGGECVEVAVTEQSVRIRDSKDLARPALTIGRDGWTRFIRHVGRG
ncbi:DUF397 domain-containing protein [Streptomyces rugosispiralis]|uniref:DUF397 domain-containing protein n=1 Tax=Streptomyces rugosispiralis TaxID=2967341 RepID=A0ABT1V7S1_9ACTN|nr:DUF397 domain-containing protein [Streptomyces rugosispiralis]MCQ8192586.1 DUF397 domain-containing protein [Streptomyces rugosispiralis]